MSQLGNKEVMAKNIRYYMEINNKTRKEMCTALGVKYTTFTDWVNGNAYPRIDKIELMANYFGINKSDLVEIHNKKNKPIDENDDRSKIEKEIIYKLRKLTPENYEIAMTTLDSLIEGLNNKEN